ncbi:MAG: hypothetical protein F6J94_12295 [Moorea sp. SIO1F2]|nr:hypothetical protein [Moorena sp. SIO1F2]NET82677.1 hypothetical protein [Moorena sp. SIO1F2]
MMKYLRIKGVELLAIPDSRFPIPDSRFPIPDSLLPITTILTFSKCWIA